MCGRGCRDEGSGRGTRWPTGKPAPGSPRRRARAEGTHGLAPGGFVLVRVLSRSFLGLMYVRLYYAATGKRASASSRDGVSLGSF